MMSNPIILALDASSTAIGWVVYDGAVLASGEMYLTGSEIAWKCRQALTWLHAHLGAYPTVDCVAIEAPVARHASAVIPQARVSGALMAAAALKKLHVIEVAPKKAKRALAGNGNTDKQAMQAKAVGYGVVGEHASDALGVALAAAGQVKVVGVAA